MIDKMQQVLKKFAPEIKSIEIVNSELPECVLNSFLGSLPQLEEAFFESVKIIRCCNAAHLNLQKLRTFKSIKSSAVVFSMLSHQTPAVLRSFSTEFIERETLRQIFEYQLNIQDVST
jgi:hypothetical protein